MHLASQSERSVLLPWHRQVTAIGRRYAPRGEASFLLPYNVRVALPNPHTVALRLRVLGRTHKGFFHPRSSQAIFPKVPTPQGDVRLSGRRSRRDHEFAVFRSAV